MYVSSEGGGVTAKRTSIYKHGILQECRNIQVRGVLQRTHVRSRNFQTQVPFEAS